MDPITKYTHYDVTFQEVPNEISLVFSISNCPCRCPGCHSKYLWEDVGKSLEEDYLQIIEKYKGYITCVCFMGGDRDPEKIVELAKEIRNQHPSLKICWYSGKSKMVDEENILYFDYIKLHPYDEKFGGLDKETTNQKFYKVNPDKSLTDLTYLFQK